MDYHEKFMLNRCGLSKHCNAWKSQKLLPNSAFLQSLKHQVAPFYHTKWSHLVVSVQVRKNHKTPGGSISINQKSKSNSPLLLSNSKKRKVIKFVGRCLNSDDLLHFVFLSDSPNNKLYYGKQTNQNQQQKKNKAKTIKKEKKNR